MKLISAAIALLASATVVSSHPLYNSSYPTTDAHLESTQTTTDWPPSETQDASNCSGFKITSQTESDISWSEYSSQEVLFDFTGSNIELVEYVDLVKYEHGAVVDEWATGPWSPQNPRTGPHEIHLDNSDTGYYQFLVIAATSDHHHCEYFSNKFLITRNDSGTHKEDVSYTPTHVAQLQADPTTTPEYYASDTTTTTSSSYPADSTPTPTISDTTGLVSIFDSILKSLSGLVSDGDGDDNWKTQIKKIEDDFAKIKNDIEAGITSGADWIQDVDTLERDLYVIKTTGTNKWTDHINSLELVLDQLKHGAWASTYDNKVKAWQNDNNANAANLTSDQELEALLKELESDGLTSTAHTSTPSSGAAFHANELPSSNSESTWSSSSYKTEYPESTPSPDEP